MHRAYRFVKRKFTSSGTCLPPGAGAYLWDVRDKSNFSKDPEYNPGKKEMKTLQWSLIFPLIAILGGCASTGEKPSTVILKNPSTMEFVNCDVDRWGTSASYERNDKCVKEYQEQGYIIWGKH